MKSSQRIVGRRGESALLRLAALSLVAMAGLLQVLPAKAGTTAVVLCVDAHEQTIAGATVRMWGYRQVGSASDCAVPGAPASPGPVLRLSPGAADADNGLQVTLVNNLPVPTSIVLPGQRLPAVSTGSLPVFATDVYGTASTCLPSASDTACRVRSFVGEAAPNGGIATYVFSNLRPGTYLYQSGTHPQVQVQMGLYGMARLDAGAIGTLYPGQAYAADVPVVLSEVDPDMHQRIHDTLGTAGNQAGWTAGGSTLGYTPRYFLVNGKVYDGSPATDLQVGTSAGNTVALRLANAGLLSRSLMLANGHWSLLSEDGYPYPAAREQYTALLPPSKTHDALVTASGTDNSAFAAFFDRRGGTHNANGNTVGGQVARLVLNSALPAENRPPIVSAGPDQSIMASATTLSGTVTDSDGPSPVATTWSQAGGPAGGAAFGSASTPSTSVSFTAPGIYTLRLTANDGAAVVYDDAVVTVVQPADLSIAKTDGVASANTGSLVTYTITVTNPGPVAVAGATVTDNVPAALGNVSWSCSASAGSSCGTASGTGNVVSGTVNVATGGTATFTVSGTLALSATGTLVNSATVTLPPGYLDTNPGNNSATDTDAIVVVPPAMTTLDTFDRANAITLGANWSQLGSAIRVNNNQAFCATGGLIPPCLLGGVAYWNVPAAGFGAKQGAAFTIASTTLSGDSLILKAFGTVTLGVHQNFIRVRTTGAQVIVESTTNYGVSVTERAAFTVSPAVTLGNRLTAVANADGTVDVWRTTAANVSTYLGRSAAASGFTGTGRVGMQLPAPGGSRVDDFAAGTLP